MGNQKCCTGTAALCPSQGTATFGAEQFHATSSQLLANVSLKKSRAARTPDNLQWCITKKRGSFFSKSFPVLKKTAKSFRGGGLGRTTFLRAHFGVGEGGFTPPLTLSLMCTIAHCKNSWKEIKPLPSVLIV